MAQLTGESFQNFCWLGALRVIGVSGSIEDGPVSIHDECRRSGQLPAFVSIGKRQIDERATINFLLIFRDPVDKAELPRNLISAIAQQGNTAAPRARRQALTSGSTGRDR